MLRLLSLGSCICFTELIFLTINSPPSYSLPSSPQFHHLSNPCDVNWSWVSWTFCRGLSGTTVNALWVGWKHSPEFSAEAGWVSGTIRVRLLFAAFNILSYLEGKFCPVLVGILRANHEFGNPRGTGMNKIRVLQSTTPSLINCQSLCSEQGGNQRMRIRNTCFEEIN